MAKPAGYWQDFANVERELRAFVVSLGTPQDMPTKGAFQAHERGDLLHAIRKHGGMAAVAARLELRQPGTHKAAGYWHDFDNLERDLRAFMAQVGYTSALPTKATFLAHQRADLMAAMQLHGGRIAVAQQLGLNLANPDKVAGYWDNFANLERELLDFITQHGQAGIMPGKNHLAEAGREDLIHAMRKYGGLAAVGERLGLRPATDMKPDGYWDNFRNIKRELCAFLASLGRPGELPPSGIFFSNGQGNLYHAIHRHGGMALVAERLGLRRPDAPHPAGYWRDFANLERELRQFIEDYGVEGEMPTLRDLQRIGYSQLAVGIRKHGGWTAVAQRLALKQVLPRQPKRWKRFSLLEEALQEFIAQQGMNGHMPSLRQLRQAGRHDLAYAIDCFGGSEAVAERLGLVYPP